MIKRNLAFVWVLSLLSLAGGCAASRPTAEHAENVRFITNRSDGVHVSKVSAMPRERGVIIQGTIERMSPYSFRGFSGHVDIEIKEPDGTVVQRVSVPIEPRELPRRGFHSARFTLNVNSVLRPGTMVSLTPHHTSAQCFAE